MKIEIYSKTTCPFCQMAKDYFRKNDIVYEEFLYDDDDERNSMYDQFGLVGNGRTVPQIFVQENNGSRYRIGGYTELMKSDLLNRNRVNFNLDF